MGDAHEVPEGGRMPQEPTYVSQNLLKTVVALTRSFIRPSVSSPKYILLMFGFNYYF